MSVASILYDETWLVNEPRIRIYKNGANLQASSLIEAVCPIGPTPDDDKQGYSQFFFDGSIFENLINPLFDTPESMFDSISFWVYAPYYLDNERQPVENFEAYIYKNNEASVNMTADIFKELIDEIQTPSVFNYDIDGVQYMTYSQAVPQNFNDTSEIEYYILLVIDADFTRTYQNDIQSALNTSSNLVIVLTLSLLAVTMAVALLITWRMSRQIKKPISEMTQLTELMKKAPNLFEKKQVVD